MISNQNLHCVILGKPAVQFQYVEKALGMLEKLINLQSPDREIITDACWALSYLSDGDNERITAVIKAGVVRRLVLLLYADMIHNKAFKNYGFKLICSYGSCSCKNSFNKF